MRAVPRVGQNRPKRLLPPERRSVAGQPPALPGGIALLAHAAKRHALALGLVAEITVSSARFSCSRYLRIVVPDRRWAVELRISDHSLRTGTTADFELVSLDGRSGLEPALRFIDGLVAGEVA